MLWVHPITHFTNTFLFKLILLFTFKLNKTNKPKCNFKKQHFLKVERREQLQLDEYTSDHSYFQFI